MINYKNPINKTFDELMFIYDLLDHLDLIIFSDFFEKRYSPEEA